MFPRIEQADAPAHTPGDPDFSADENHSRLAALDAGGAGSLAKWIGKVRQAWLQVRVEVVDSALPAAITVRERVDFRVRVPADPLAPDDLQVELCLGPLDAGGNIIESMSVVMIVKTVEAAGRYLYEVSAGPCYRSGRYGFTARVLPRYKDAPVSFMPGLITWAAK